MLNTREQLPELLVTEDTTLRNLRSELITAIADIGIILTPEQLHAILQELTSSNQSLIEGVFNSSRGNKQIRVNSILKLNNCDISLSHVSIQNI